MTTSRKFLSGLAGLPKYGQRQVVGGASSDLVGDLFRRLFWMVFNLMAAAAVRWSLDSKCDMFSEECHVFDCGNRLQMFSGSGLAESTRRRSDSRNEALRRMWRALGRRLGNASVSLNERLRNGNVWSLNCLLVSSILQVRKKIRLEWDRKWCFSHLES